MSDQKQPNVFTDCRINVSFPAESVIIERGDPNLEADHMMETASRYLTDLDRFRALFDSVGLKYGECERTEHAPETVAATLQLDEGDRPLHVWADGLTFGGMRCDFYFDASGKFVSHGVWE
jgi:hypothetical protein